MSKYRYGNRPDLPDKRDYTTQLDEVQLPPEVDLRSSLPAVYDQGDLGSCTANAGAAAFDYDRIAQGKPYINPSRLFLYYNERQLEGTTASDSGATIRDTIKAAKKYGVVPETKWPYDVAKFANKPSDALYTEAAKEELLTYARVARSQFQQALAQQHCFMAGITVYASFESDEASKTGVIPIPAVDEDVLGGHAILICGYKQIDGALYYIFRNSWGSSWGDKGYGYLPEAYLHNSQLASDFWVMKTVAA